MRYTTIIDITELDIYRNVSCRLVYLHLACKSGYHDDDRDTLHLSIRRIAADVGITVSAARHAISQLMAAQLLKRLDDGRWHVLKWIVATPPTPRRQQQKQASDETNKMMDRWEKQVEEYRQKVYAAVRQSSKDELQQWIAELAAGKKTKHHGVTIAPNANNIAWLQQVVDKM